MHLMHQSAEGIQAQALCEVNPVDLELVDLGNTFIVAAISLVVKFMRRKAANRISF